MNQLRNPMFVLVIALILGLTILAMVLIEPSKEVNILAGLAAIVLLVVARVVGIAGGNKNE